MAKIYTPENTGRCKVILDGIEQKYCFEACPEHGYIRSFVRRGKRMVVNSAGDILTQIQRGEVRIYLMEIENG